MADDLGDDWWLEKSPKSFTESENKKVNITKDHDKNAENEKEKITAKNRSNSNKKRKLEKPEISGLASGTESNRQKNKRKKKNITTELAEGEVQTPSPGEFVTALMNYYEDKLSGTERGDIQLTDDNFVTSKKISQTYNEYMSELIPKWSKLVRKHKNVPGRPLILVISSSAIRSVQLNRELSEFKGDKCKVAKLFAKHLKVEEQRKYMEKNTIHLGIGTPHRIIKLLQEGILSLECLRYIVLDWSWRDQKLKRLIDKQELHEELFQLSKEYLVPAIINGEVKMCLV